MPRLSLDSPVGRLTLTEQEGAITVLEWGGGGSDATPLLRRAADQLQAYFAGRRHSFNLPLQPRGTAFQLRVYGAMSAIPYGTTRSYGELAADLHSSPRAVGTACGRNPLPILVPCHRVVASGGRPGGYSGQGGLATKRQLLALEGLTLRLT